METVIWDFDGTLGYRSGGRWTASVLEVARREVSGPLVTNERCVRNLIEVVSRLTGKDRDA